MRKSKILTVLLVPLLAFTGNVVACGPGDSLGSSGLGKFSSNNRGFAPQFGFNPMMGNQFAMAQQFNAHQQLLAAQAAARRARTRPIQLAKAMQLRQTKLAKRQEFREVMIAKQQQREQQQEMFAANARTWKDSTGKYSVAAQLVGYDGGSVRLKKADGLIVSVPMGKLCLTDQVWVDNNGGIPWLAQSAPTQRNPSTTFLTSVLP